MAPSGWLCRLSGSHKSLDYLFRGEVDNGNAGIARFHFCDHYSLASEGQRQIIEIVDFSDKLDACCQGDGSKVSAKMSAGGLRAG